MKNLILFLILACGLMGAPSTPVNNALLTGTATVPTGASLAPTGSGTIAATGLTGAATISGTITRTNLDTIIITANAGTIDVTKGAGSATNGAATALTLSSDSTTTNTYLSRDLVNSDTSAHVFTLKNAANTTIATVTVPGSTTIPVTLRSTGSAWILYGGALTTNDLPANTTPATTDVISTTNPTTGLNSKSTVTQVVSQGFPAAIPNGATATTQSAGSADTKVATDAYADTAAKSTNLGTFASPDTTAGSITWSSAVYQVLTSASGGARTYTLPAAAGYAGRGLIVYVVAGTNNVNVKPASGERIVLAGTQLTSNHKIQFTTSAAGNFVCLINPSGATWIVLGTSGTLVDGGT